MRTTGLLSRGGRGTGAMALAACTGDAEGKSGAEPPRTTLVLATGGRDLTGFPECSTSSTASRGCRKGA